MMHQLIGKKKNIYIYLFLFFLLSTINNFNFKIFFEENFKIKNIITNDNIVKELKYLIDKNIFFLDKKNITAILENYPILKSFQINKIYPNSLEVKIYRTKHLAMINVGDKTMYIGENGKIFEDKKYQSKLPLIVGDPDIETINYFLNLLKKSNLNSQEIDSLKFYPSKRWDIIFNNKTIIKLPEKNVLFFINKAKKLLNDKKFDKKIIDLRLTNKIILSDG